MRKAESDLPMELAQPARRALVGAGYRRRGTVHGASARPRSSIFTGLGQRRLLQLRRKLGRLGLSFADEQSRNTQIFVFTLCAHEIHGRDLAVPPFPHHPMIERSAFDEKNYRPIFYNA